MFHSNNVQLPIVRLLRHAKQFLRSKSKTTKTATTQSCKTTQEKSSEGKPATTAESTRKVVKIYRFNGIRDTDIKPRMQSIECDTSKCGPLVLDLLLMLKEIDPTITFRRSCREGICGSCGALVNGNTVLSCIHKIPKTKVIIIKPLPHMYVIRDLVVDMTHFYNAYNSIRPYLIRKTPLKIGEYQLAQSPKDNNKLVGLYECVLCGCCACACPSYWWNGRRFLGPTTLLHAYRWVIDSRDEDTDRRLEDLRDDFKLFRCHTIFNCSLVCPKMLNPALVIAKLKLLVSGLTKKDVSEIDSNTFKAIGPSSKEGCKAD